MADKTINVKIKEAYDTEANQKSKNPVLLKGQMAISSDVRKAKVGDGMNPQQKLSYMNAESANSASTATKATQDGSGNVITSTYATKTELDKKVDKVDGKGLSTNDFTSDYKTKLDGIESGAQKNAVTGVKGNSESNYRTGNINLTADNVGALSKSGSIMNRNAMIQWGNAEDQLKNDPNLKYPIQLGGLYQNEQSDSIKLYGEETARDNLDLVLQFGDDNSNKLSIRNNVGTQTAYIKATGEIGGSFNGNLSGNVTGNVTGNASTASKLATARNIKLTGAITGNANFDGSANISIGTTIADRSLQPSKLAIKDFYNYSELNENTASELGFTVTPDVGGTIYSYPACRDKPISTFHTCNGGERIRIKGQIASNCKAADNQHPTADYVWTTIQLFCFSKEHTAVGFPGAIRVQATSDSKQQSIDSECTIPTNARCFQVMVQTAATSSQSGTIKVRNINVTKVEEKAVNSDRLDDYHASISATKNTVVVRDNNNYSQFNYINTNVGVDGAKTDGSRITSNSNFLYANSDGMIRKSAKSNFVQALEVLPTSGGILTGQLKINGAAADKPLMVRGIVGSDGNGTEGELYLNYGVDASIKIGKEGKTYFDSSGIFHGSVTGSVSGNASTATTLQTSRSINGTNFNGSANITTANQGTARNITITDNSGAHSGTATSVNGSQAYTLKMPATISASFIGSLDGNAKTATSATRASQDGNGANIASTYVKKTDLGSSMTVSAMGKNNFLLTADGCLYTSTKTETGFLMITIPHPYKNTGIKFKVSIYTNGDNTPTEYWISGKSSTSFNQMNCGAYSVGKYRNAFSNLPVVFSTDSVYKTLLPVNLIENSKYIANDNGAKLIGETIGTKYGTKCFISIGRSNTKQVSPTIVISDIMLNDAVSDFNSWKAGWTMAFTTTQKTGIDVTVNNPNILQDGHASLDLPLSGGTMSGGLIINSQNGLTISAGSDATVGMNSNGPKITFNSGDNNQKGQLLQNHIDSYQNPASLTLLGDQGNEYFIAPNIKAKSNLYGNLAGTQNGIIDDHGTENQYDTQIPVFTNNKMQHRVSQNIRMSLSGTTLTITA